MNQLDMKFHKINEGLFKDLDKNIVSIDDPDYEEKVKDQTFKNFQEADAQTKINAIREWICDHISVYCGNSYQYIKNCTLSKEEENTFFKIVKDDNGDYYIDLLGWKDIQKTISGVSYNVTLEYTIISGINYKSPFTDSGELPYRFNSCMGSFEISETVAGLMKSYKNIPDYVEINCILNADAGLVNEYSIPLSTLPKNLTVGNSLFLYNVKTLKGMPDNIKVGKTFFIQGSLETMEGWNPTTTVKYLTVHNNLRSIKGLPDGFTCDELSLSSNLISEIKDWPKNLNITGKLDLSYNGLTLDSLEKHPFPDDASVEFLIIGSQYDENTKQWRALDKRSDRPVVIPAGIKDFSIWAVDRVEHMPISEKTYQRNNSYWKQLSRTKKLNEGLFKDLDKNIINPDDPDYEQKVKDQTFNNFQEHDRNIKKQVVIDWICDHILYNTQSGGEKWDPESFKPSSYIHPVEPEDEGILFTVDDDYGIHLLTPLACDAKEMGWPEQSCWWPCEIHGNAGQIKRSRLAQCFYLSAVNKINGPLPYKIKECQCHLAANYCGLTSLKGFPEKIGFKDPYSGNWIHMNLYLNNNKLQSLIGCPQEGIYDLFLCNNKLKTLNGAPKSIAGTIDLSDNFLYNLNHIPVCGSKLLPTMFRNFLSFEGVKPYLTAFKTAIKSNFGIEDKNGIYNLKYGLRYFEKENIWITDVLDSQKAILTDDGSF